MNISKFRNIFFALMIAAVVGAGTFMPDTAYAARKIRTYTLLTNNGDCTISATVTDWDDGTSTYSDIVTTC